MVESTIYSSRGCKRLHRISSSIVYRDYVIIRSGS